MLKVDKEDFLPEGKGSHNPSEEEDSGFKSVSPMLEDSGTISLREYEELEEEFLDIEYDDDSDDEDTMEGSANVETINIKKSKMRKVDEENEMKYEPWVKEEELEIKTNG